MKTVALRTSLAAIALAIASTVAQAQDVTLTVSHFLGPKSPTHARFIEPWARKVEADSNGRIRIEIFPSMTLGGKPPELYRQLRDGAADIVWTVTGYTPGVFPRSEVFELPTVHQGSARATNLAIQDTWDLISEDFGDLKPLLVHVHAGQAIHMVDGCLGGVGDLAGKKLRTPSRTGGWMIEAWGAEPVGMPVPALPQALSKGVVDGTLIPFEVMPPFKIHELTTCSQTGVNGTRFGTAVFLFGMNKDSYAALPDDLKAVIDANSGAAIAEEIGMLWDGIEGGGEKMQAGTGSPVLTMDAAATEAMNAPLQAVIDRWIEEADGAGLDGAALVEAARKAIAAHSD